MENVGSAAVTATFNEIENIPKLIENIKKFGLEVVVGVNHFITDTEKEIKIIEDYCNKMKVKFSVCTHFIFHNNFTNFWTTSKKNMMEWFFQ